MDSGLALRAPRNDERSASVRVIHFPINLSNSLCRHHPRKRVIQYSRALVFIIGALEYWIVRSSRTMTTEYRFSFSRQFFVRVLQIYSRLFEQRARATLKRGRGEGRVLAAPAVSCAMGNKTIRT